MIVHNTDGRYTTPETINNDVYLSYLDLPGDPVEPKLVPHDPGKKDDKLVAKAKAEGEAVDRIRKYRVEADGKKYQLLRGEFHRHTEMSWDGGPDGSLEDMFRYAIDAAAMDWISNDDHDNGGGREYSWWLTQKLTDAYHVAGHFTPMFSYERSVSYPHGHRNCVFARRGVRTLPRLAAAPDKPVAGVSPDDTKMLYRYLKEFDGICASHTSATGMGTDWRDNDPQVEPLVEIYQGDRMNYEYEGARARASTPRATRSRSRSAAGSRRASRPRAEGEGLPPRLRVVERPLVHAHFLLRRPRRESRPAGHPRRAEEAPRLRRHRRHHPRRAQRHASDGRRVQDERGSVAGHSRHRHRPRCADRRAQRQRGGRDDQARQGGVTRGRGPTRSRRGGVHYYYVRVQQDDGQLAWGSPMWVDYEK